MMRAFDLSDLESDADTFLSCGDTPVTRSISATKSDAARRTPSQSSSETYTGAALPFSTTANDEPEALNVTQ